MADAIEKLDRRREAAGRLVTPYEMRRLSEKITTMATPTAGATTEAHILPVRVYLEDTDAQGFVYHASYLRYFERARSEILDSIGYPMADIAHGTHRFVVYEIKLRYHRPARLGERLEIRTEVQRSSGYRLTFRQQATKVGEAGVLVRAEVEVVSLDERGELLELPAALSVLWDGGPKLA